MNRNWPWMCRKHWEIRARFFRAAASPRARSRALVWARFRSKSRNTWRTLIRSARAARSVVAPAQRKNCNKLFSWPRAWAEAVHWICDVFPTGDDEDDDWETLCELRYPCAISDSQLSNNSINCCSAWWAISIGRGRLGASASIRIRWAEKSCGKKTNDSNYLQTEASNKLNLQFTNENARLFHLATVHS